MEPFQKQALEILESVPKVKDPVTGILNPDYWNAIQIAQELQKLDPGDNEYWGVVTSTLENNWDTQPLRSKRNF